MNSKEEIKHLKALLWTKQKEIFELKRALNHIEAENITLREAYFDIKQEGQK